MRGRGMSCVDLVVLIAVAGFVFFALVACSSTSRSRETANRVKCANNLRQIGQAMALYADDNGGHYPRTIYAPGMNSVAGTGPGAPDPFAPDAVAPNDVTAAMFLLLRTQDLSTSRFVCPSTRDKPDGLAGRPVTQRSNFSSITANLSYSFQNMYPNAGTVDANTYWTRQMNPETVLAADRNPGTAPGNISRNSPQSQIRTLNSANHGQDGQNMLYADGHIDFANTPFAGVNADNIYADSSGAVNGSPANDTDSVMIP